MERFGQFKEAVNPGLKYYNPFSENIREISLKTRVIDMPKQTVYTKDNMSVFIDTSLFFRIIDTYNATYIVKDILASLMQMTFVTLRTICGEYVNFN
jgi:erythrocyte band 7 integral membrane protein